MNILEEIVEQKKNEIIKLKQNFSNSSFEGMEFFNSNNFSLIDNINKEKNISIIAELKRKSPSKGIINKEFEYKNIIQTYFNSKIAGVSVLTDEKYFGGNINLLKKIAKNKNLPLLRKDFIIDSFQVSQSKAFGADVILLICEALSANQIKELTLAAHELGLEVLLELHDEKQINKIDFSLNKLIGINNRNLSNFTVDINSSVSISKLLPDNVTVISESGIMHRLDLIKLKKTKIKAVLVGEYLMSAENLNIAIESLKGWCNVKD